MSFKNNNGFSLIELMVVVAIIAILATIAIPSYQGFQAKARQKEGLGLLSGFYTSAQATYAEVGGFPGDFVSTGFAPAGQLGYRVTSEGNNAVQTQITMSGFGTVDAACVNTNVACNCGGSCPMFKTWDEKDPGSAALVGPAPATIAMVSNTGQTFETQASGYIKTGAGSMADERSINERKVIDQQVDGLL